MKKLLSLILCLAMAMATLTIADADGIYPIDTDETLTIWVGGHPTSVTATIAEHAWYQGFAEKTGINLEWIEPTAGASAEQAFNLMIADKTLPDIIIYAEPVKNAAAYIADGIIIPLNDYIEEYAPNLNAYFEANPTLANTYKTDDGQIFCFPQFGEGMSNTGLVIDSTKLEECGLEVPTTIDELSEVLTAFHETYGIAPFTMLTQTMDIECMGNYGVMNTIYDAYGIPNRYCFFRDQDQVVHFSVLEEGYRQALAQLAEWYAAGYIDPDYASVSYRDVSAKAAAGEVGVMVADFEVWARINAITGTEENNWIAVQDPVLNEGDILWGFNSASSTMANGAVITTACDNVELAMQLLDYAYSPEGIVYFNYGIEGESFTFDENGDPHYTDLYRNGPLGMDEYANIYTPPVCGHVTFGYNSYDAGFERNSEIMREAERIWNEGLTRDFFWQMPMLGPTAEETERFADLNTTIQTYCGEMHHKFLTGSLSIEEDWDDFMNTLEEMGVSELVAIKQAQLDRFNAR